MLILGHITNGSQFFFSCKYFAFVIRTKLKLFKLNTTTVAV